jgi:prepilin-type N-terminal cleavage/methylation domain-containing protein
MIATRRSRGFSLIELLSVIVVMAILAAVVLTGSAPSYHEQLQSAARVVAAELNHVRSLAETDGSRYTATFDIDANRMVVQHSGTNAALDHLTRAVFLSKDDTAEQHVLDLDEMDCFENVSFSRVAVLSTSLEPATSVEFGPLGETTAQYPTLIWLAGGPEDSRLYLLIAVDPATGMVSIGEHIGRSAVPLITEHAALRDVTGASPALPSEPE